MSTKLDRPALHLPHQPRPKVQWHDLVPLRLHERVWECTLSLPWLFGSLLAYARAGPPGASFKVSWFLIAALCSFFFFLTGLRQSHNAQHMCLGIGRRGHHAMLMLLSLLMLASMHSVRVTHLHHHRHCLSEHDEEARHAAWPWHRVLLSGPWLFVRSQAIGFRLGARGDRIWIAIESLGIIAVVLLAIILPVPIALRWHVLAMVTGECLTGFFAVWIVHRGCHAHGQIARTQRGWLKNIISYAMFYHLEHHLWPAVPTCHLDTLSQRLDAVAPQFREKQVI